MHELRNHSILLVWLDSRIQLVYFARFIRGQHQKEKSKNNQNNLPSFITASLHLLCSFYCYTAVSQWCFFVIRLLT